MIKKTENSIKERKEQTELSPLKKHIFWGITLFIPLLIFVITEISLQIINYGGNLDLFIDGPAGYENYKQPNPNVARRYFSNENSVPTPPIQLFRKEKKENGLRIIVLGGSTTAGFPYSNNLSFPKILESKLNLKYPAKDVEVINLAMSAINSYSLLDLMDEVVEEKPDAILVYAGHNEFYGALGVGSVQTLGNWRWLVRTYLQLNKVRTFILLKDFVTLLRNSIATTVAEQRKDDPASTLMSRIVGEQTIELDSDLYVNGKEQFAENIEMIIEKAKDNNIPIILSELVSNIRDQQPFVSIDDNQSKSANYFFNKARNAENKGNFKTAKIFYKSAKDLDALRFRSPEDFNAILHEIIKKHNIPLVQLQSYFEEESENGIYGENLFLEHLHPNKEGYNLIAKAFYNTIIESKILTAGDSNYKANFDKIYGYTELDSVYAGLVIEHLKGGWPFKSESTVNNFFNIFKPKNKLEEIAIKIMLQENYNLESGHMELAEFYKKNGDLDKSFNEYLAMITSIPHEVSFYQDAATVLISQKKYNQAFSLLKNSLKFKKSDFAMKWIGQIALINKEYSEAIEYLKLANRNDPQVLFNLSRSYYQNNEVSEGDKYLKVLAQNYPNSKYVPYLYKMKKKQ